MENQTLINDICHILIDKKIYVDFESISTVFSYLDNSTLADIKYDLGYIKG